MLIKTGLLLTKKGLNMFDVYLSLSIMIFSLQETFASQDKTLDYVDGCGDLRMIRLM